LRTGSAERIEAPDASVDAVVATLVLCSVDDLGRTLREVQRVLKPGGTFAFVEHVAAPRGTRLRRAQALIRPVWRIVADGCTPDRETWVALEGAGFETLAYDCFRMPSPVGLLSPGIAGKATTHA
jgi:ubiquinone/menaquinone biosynthesis C-methylase UbiE